MHSDANESEYAPMPVEQEFEPIDRPIWGVAAIAAAANLTERQAYWALEQGHLPASKLGRRWFTTPRRLRALFAGEHASQATE